MVAIQYKIVWFYDVVILSYDVYIYKINILLIALEGTSLTPSDHTSSEMCILVSLVASLLSIF